MKFFAVLVFCLVLCYDVSEAEESQWSILRQSEYDVKIEIARVESFNRSYFKYLKLEAVPYNRTYRAINATFEFTLNLNKQLLGGVQVYKFLSNEYRFFPITFEFDTCTEYHHDSFGMKHFFDRVSNYNPCIIKKDVVYRLVNAIPDYSKWPPHIPLGRYSVQLDVLDKGNRNNMAILIINVEIKETPKNWT